MFPQYFKLCYYIYVFAANTSHSGEESFENANLFMSHILLFRISQ